MLVLFFIFVALPLLELALLLKFGALVGGLPTLLLVMVTGVVGAGLARQQGYDVLARLRREAAAGNVPAGAMVDGALIFVAATLLITPGLITDCVGFALLIPLARNAMKRALSRRLAEAVRGGQTLIFISPRRRAPVPPRSDPNRVYEARFEDD